MSLMNDALRKKNREIRISPPAAGSSDAARRPRPIRRWAFLLAAVILITGAALAGIHLMQSDTANALLVKPNRPRPGAARAVTSSITQRSEDTTTEPIPTGGSPEMHVTGEMPATAGPATGHGLATPTSSKTKAKPSAPRPQTDVTTAEPEDAQPAPATVSHGSMTTDAPVEPFHGRLASASRAFEPGPEQSGQRDLRPSSAQRRAPATAAIAPAPPETIGESDEGQTSRPTVDANPDTDLFYQKACSYHRSGRLTEAIRLYRQVLKSSSGHAGAMLNLAAAAMQRGNFLEAQALLQRLEHASPRPQGVLLNLAIAAIGTGAPEQALAYLDRAAAMSDASPWEIRFHRAVAFARMNRLPEALVLYRAAEKEQPEAPGLQFNLAVTCDALGLYPEALAHYEAVLQAAAKPSETDQTTITQRIRTIGRYLDTARSPGKG